MGGKKKKHRHQEHVYLDTYSYSKWLTQPDSKLSKQNLTLKTYLSEFFLPYIMSGFQQKITKHTKCHKLSLNRAQESETDSDMAVMF